MTAEQGRQGSGYTLNYSTELKYNVKSVYNLCREPFALNARVRSERILRFEAPALASPASLCSTTSKIHQLLNAHGRVSLCSGDVAYRWTIQSPSKHIRPPNGIVMTSQVPVPPQELLVPGSDDFQLRVFKYNPQDKEVAFEAHPDYIRYLAVHPTLALVLTSSDDMTIKSWDWDKS